MIWRQNDWSINICNDYCPSFNNDQMNATENLKEWYNTECTLVSAEVGKHKKFLFQLIKFYFWIFGIMLFIFSAFVILFFTWADPERIEKVYSFMFYFFFIIIAATSNIYLIYVFAKAKFATLETLEKKGLISPIDTSRFNLLITDILDLTERMSIERDRIVIWQLFSNNKYPSIEEDKQKKIHLVLPVNFILLYKKNPVEFKAIITHELAHVIQRDTEIFQVCNTYYTIMRTLFIPNAIFNIVVVVYLIFRTWDRVPGTPEFFYFSSGLVLVINLLIISVFNERTKKVTQAREKSELLADTSSYIHYGAGILNLLKENKEIENPNGYHPSPQKRFDNLTNLLAKYNV